MIKIKSFSPLSGNFFSKSDENRVAIQQTPSEYSIYVLLDGVLLFQFLVEQLILKPKMMLIAFPEEEYTVCKQTENVDCRKITFVFPESGELYELIHEKVQRIFALPAKSLNMLELIEFDNKTATRESVLSMSHILSAILYSTLDNSPSAKPLSATYESYVENSIDYMNRHIFNKVTLSEISEAVGVCGYHYIRLFKSVTGVTPMNYFLKLKTAKAAELLKNTALSISEIAEKLQFSSDAHFSRTFKRHMGYTPSAYRRQASLFTSKYMFNDILLQTIIDSSPDLIFFKDTNFVLLGCNAAFCRVLGLERAQIIGKRDVDLFPYKEALFYNRIDQAILDSGTPHSNREWMTLPDGEQKRYEVMKAPFYDEADNVSGIVGISREIPASKSKARRGPDADKKNQPPCKRRRGK